MRVCVCVCGRGPNYPESQNILAKGVCVLIRGPNWLAPEEITHDVGEGAGNVKSN